MPKMILLILLAISKSAYAGDVISKIERIGLINDQYANVKIVDSISDAPECSDSDQYLSFDKTTEHGRQLYSTLLSAFVTDIPVYFNYANSCALYGKGLNILG